MIAFPSRSRTAGVRASLPRDQRHLVAFVGKSSGVGSPRSWPFCTRGDVTEDKAFSGSPPFGIGFGFSVAGCGLYFNRQTSRKIRRTSGFGDWVLYRLVFHQRLFLRFTDCKFMHGANNSPISAPVRALWGFQGWKLEIFRVVSRFRNDTVRQSINPNLPASMAACCPMLFKHPTWCA